MSWLNNLSIRRQMISILAIVTIAIVAIELTSLNKLRDSLHKDKQQIAQHIVELAISLLEHQHQLAKQGQISEEQAQNQAMSLIQSLRYDGSQYIWINDMKPNMIMHPFKPELNGKPISNIKDPNGKALFVEMVQKVRAEGKGFVEYQWEKPGHQQPQNKISFVQGFKPWGWVVGSGIYIDDVESIYFNSAIKKIAIDLIIFVVLFVFIRAISNSLVSAMASLQTVMKDISEKNDLSRRVPISGDNELGQIGTGLNRMLSGFSSSIKNVMVAVDQLASSAEELSVIADQTSNGVRNQHKELDLFASAMEELSISVKEVTDNTGSTAEATEKAHLEAENGHATVKSAMDGINQLANEVENASEVINGLQTDSENIGAILDVIRSIAEQTNLLALNAAIEAARAGEQGRGFAVVADEVRTLASRTQESIEEIETMIEQLQEGSSNAVSVMNEGRKMASSSVDQILQVSSSLNRINDMIALIRDQSLSIATTANQQSSVANDMAKNVTNINAIAEDTSNGANETATACSSLAKLAEDLRDISHRFHVE